MCGNMHGMSQTFGMEMPSEKDPGPHRAVARFLVVIDAGGSMVAKLFRDSRVLMAEFDAAVEEVGAMTAGVVAQAGALGSEWDVALAGHSAAERAGAQVYTLSI
jgi:hypothetical protein